MRADDWQPVSGAEEIVALQKTVREVPITDHVIRYVLSLVRQTRVGEVGIPDFVQDMVSWGAGPRAVQFLILGGNPLENISNTKTLEQVWQNGQRSGLSSSSASARRHRSRV